MAASRGFRGLLLAAVSAATLAWSGTANADLVTFTLGRNVEYNQTSTSPPTSIDDAFLSMTGYENSLADFDTGSVTYPGVGSPQSLAPNGSVSFPGIGFQTPAITKAQMDTLYPFGTYTINVSNSVTHATNTATQNYTADFYTPTIPALDAASFDKLQ